MLLRIDYLKDVSGDLKLLGNGKMGWAIFSAFRSQEWVLWKENRKNMVLDV